VVEFISYGGAMTAANGPATGVTSTDIGVAEPSNTPIGQSLQLSGCLGELAWTGPATSSFGAVSPINTADDCGVPQPTPVKIHEIQGSGAATPIPGELVQIEGVVVGDHEGPGSLLGFMVQEEDADVDDDPASSEGIFVFHNNPSDLVNVGDVVRVTGTVTERFTQTVLTGPTVEVLGSGAALPTPATIEFPVAELAALEAYEGMLALLPQELVISEYFNYERFGEVVVALPAPGEERPMSPTAVFDPESQEAADRASLNLRSRITIDDGITAQNPENLIHPVTRTLFSQENAFRGGDTVTGLLGPIFFDFNLYRILPYGDLDGDGTADGYATFEQTTAPTEPDPVGGTLRVASMNTLNYFLTIDTTASSTVGDCGPLATLDCRGADDAGEFERQRVKLLNALEGLDADVIGLNELENTPGVEPLADIVAGLNERFGAGTYDYVVAGDNSVVGTDAIKVGMIYRPGAVTPLGDAAVLDTPEFVNPLGGDLDRSRPAVAQSFVENATGEVFSVVANHLKSKGSECPEQTEPVGLAGNCDQVRRLAAEALVDWIAGDPTGVDDDDWLIIGDLNSYDHEGPIDVIEAAGYTDLAFQFHGELAYSYVFDGQSGYLDYALASGSILPSVTGMTDWHINADTPDVFDYDTTFKGPYQESLFDPTTPFRASDHDAVILGLDLDSGITVSATPDSLWPPNHKLRRITLRASDGTSTGFVVEALDGASSEADSGLGRDDVPNDIVITGGALELRAERYSTSGRTYTIEVAASGGGQVKFGSIAVFVPHSLGRFS
jgi:predicted extracellular nuclease